MQRMQKYIDQLLVDLLEARPAVIIRDSPFFDPEDGDDWLMDMEEADLAARKPLSEWTGIRQEQLPPARMLSDEQILALLHEIIDLLQAFNLSATFHTFVPERKQYHAIRESWNQEVPFLKFSMYYLSYCNQDQKNCPLGQEFCQCAFLEDYLSDSMDLEEDDFDDPDSDLPWKNDSRFRRGLGWDDLDL